MANINISFGKRVVELRKQLNLTQVQLAINAGLNPTYMGEIERGEKNVSLQVIEQIATGLNITIKELFDYE